MRWLVVQVNKNLEFWFHEKIVKLKYNWKKMWIFVFNTTLKKIFNDDKLELYFMIICFMIANDRTEIAKMFLKTTFIAISRKNVIIILKKYIYIFF